MTAVINNNNNNNNNVFAYWSVSLHFPTAGCSAEDGRLWPDCLPTADQRRPVAVAADVIAARLQEQQTRLHHQYPPTTYVSRRHVHYSITSHAFVQCRSHNTTTVDSTWSAVSCQVSIYRSTCCGCICFD